MSLMKKPTYADKIASMEVLNDSLSNKTSLLSLKRVLRVWY